MLIGKERRIAHRQNVNLKGQVKAIYPGFKGELSATIINISQKGALLTINQVTIEGRHLVIDTPPPSLNLNFEIEGNPHMFDFDIKWYRIVEGDRHFEVGIQFKSLSDNDKKTIKKFCKKPFDPA